MSEPELDLVLGDFAFQIALQVVQHARPVVGVEMILEGRERVLQLVVLVADHALPLGGEKLLFAPRVPVPNAVVAAVDGEHVLFPALFDALLSAPQVRDIDQTFDEVRPAVDHGPHHGLEDRNTGAVGGEDHTLRIIERLPEIGDGAAAALRGTDGAMADPADDLVHGPAEHFGRRGVRVGNDVRPLVDDQYSGLYRIEN